MSSPFEIAQNKFMEEYSKHETKDFTSLESELWWFVRNCSEDNFHEPLSFTDEHLKDLLSILKKWGAMT